MSSKNFDRLFILEMANNHMGDIDHGIRIIREMHEVLHDLPLRFAVKFQYRYLDTFVHPNFRDRKDIKLIKRFTETMLSEDDYKRLRDEVRNVGWMSICTPFDEKAIDLIVEHEYDVLKIPSCYFSDWPYLEAIAKTNLPIIGSTAGATPTEIAQVVSFLQHRNKDFAIMHCVAEYPTDDKDLQLNHIDTLRKRYENVPIGFSTHESPENLDSIKIAISKGASLFEKHVGVRTEKYDLNAYSANPAQVREWALAALKAYEMCGVQDGPKPITQKEKADLKNLYRGVFAKKAIRKGETINPENSFLAMPSVEDQIIGQQMSKYTEYVAEVDIEPLAPVFHFDVKTTHLRDWVEQTITKAKALLKAGNINLPNKVEVEISHHMGIEKFNECGAVIVNVINREYCKKLLIILPDQKYPSHSHKTKDETLHVLWGDVNVHLADKDVSLKCGDLFPIERGTSHGFSTRDGVVIEEISTTYVKGDSYYEDSIYNNPKRKTYLTYWSDWLE